MSSLFSTAFFHQDLGSKETEATEQPLLLNSNTKIAEYHSAAKGRIYQGTSHDLTDAEANASSQNPQLNVGQSSSKNATIRRRDSGLSAELQI